MECNSLNNNFKVKLKDCIEENQYKNIFIDISRLCMSCSRFLKFCVCSNEKTNKKPLWYVRVSKTNNNDLFHIDLSCIKLSLYKHLIHFPFPSFLIKSLACTNSDCSEILNSCKMFMGANTILCQNGHKNELY